MIGLLPAEFPVNAESQRLWSGSAGSRLRERIKKLSSPKKGNKEELYMQGTMKTAVMTGLKELEWEQRPIPVPSKGEVLVRVEHVGICGSDLHYYEQGAIGDFKVSFPFVLGHEAAGTVVEIGEGVTDLAVGDRVAMEPGKTCGQCIYCKTGRYNLCPDVEFFATPPIDGVFCEYVAHPASLCFRLPENMDTIEGALIEPLAVGFHAANQGGARLGQKAVVMGAGCIGLMTLLALKAFGVTEVYVVDVMENRLAKAKELGAAGIINGKEQDAVEELMRATAGKGMDLCIDTAGSQITMNQCIGAAAKGAAVVFVGYSAQDQVSLDINNALNKELTFKTVFRYRNLYPLAIEAVSQGLNVKGVVTDFFKFDDVRKAMDLSVSNKAEIVKAVLSLR
ncbi:putative chlorophyll synthesis pathway protein BchC [[Clostridium] leptum DSM 753]|nr:putative chlorophyll synthesis pathway protein BchC [[Clostridium] leptum DSM 753]